MSADVIAASEAWLRTMVVERDVDAGWPLTDPDFRRLLVLEWAASNKAGRQIYLSQETEEARARLVELLVDGGDEAAETEDFHPWTKLRRHLRSRLAGLGDGFDLERWRPLKQPIGSDDQVVVVWAFDRTGVAESVVLAHVERLTVALRPGSDGAWRVFGVVRDEPR